ncbi:allantoin permease [Lentzea flava]|uniref:Allantoin permease n=1 Tax=Lentzea flava TaxID=103732 RepID=A0ABQ2UKX4_9PSEU|nr:nucleobase:cation symporter-1, NCS1 family [Lentzea flava]GGU38147.1 allantoin permease [Lentzea flava]
MVVASAEKTFEVERKGIDWITDEERHGTPRRLFWPWFAANASFFTVAYGVFVVGLGLSPWQGALAVIIGLGVSYPVVGLVALAGMRGGAPTMTLSRAAFGVHGNRLPTLFVYLSLVGWETISVSIGALATRTVLARIDQGLASTRMVALGFALTVAVVIVVGIYGYNLILRVQKYITIAVMATTIVYFALIVPTLDFSRPAAGGGIALFAGGVSLVIANGIGWTSGGGDYSRYLPRTSSPRAVAGWTAVGAGSAPLVLMLFGVLLTAGNPALAAAAAADPVGAFAAALPTWFLFPFLLATMLSVIAGAVFNLYSSGLNLQALGVRLPRWAAVAIDGVIMVVGGVYLVFVTPSFFAPLQAFLIVIGVVTAAWSSIFVVDLWLFRRAGYVPEALYDPRGAYGRFNVAGVVSLVVAVGVGWGLVTSQDPNLRHVLGYLLGDAARAGSIGAANIGVAVAFFVGGLLYAVISRRGAR